MNTDQLKLSSTILLANSSNSNNYYLNIFMTMLLSSLLTGIINYVCTSFHIKNIKKYIINILEEYNVYKKEYKIILSSQTIYLNKRFGCNDITQQKIAVLNYIKKNMDNYTDLYKLKQDYIKKGVGYYGQDIENTKTECFYSIYQNKDIIIKTEGPYYLKIKSIDEQIDHHTDEKDKSNITLNNLTLISNKSLCYIKNFIEECVELKHKEDEYDTNQYIFNYIGQDEDKRLNYNIEPFIPYTNFDTLVGKSIKQIEKNIDFFISEEGHKWYKKRGLPYQLTHLYYGNPGTGKSIIASAIANKYKLHIVKIKLSTIKDNNEFCKVFKNCNFNGKKINYDKILYLFDEIDTEFEYILKRQEKMNNINENKKEKDIVFNNNLTIGPILEELNGINQMYGRIMIFITNNYNKLYDIHNGALVRPGRVDLTIEFKKLSIDDCINMINIFFPGEMDESIVFHMKDKQYTAAELSNVCKICMNFEKLIEFLN